MCTGSDGDLRFRGQRYKRGEATLDDYTHTASVKSIRCRRGQLGNPRIRIFYFVQAVALDQIASVQYNMRRPSEAHARLRGLPTQAFGEIVKDSDVRPWTMPSKLWISSRSWRRNRRNLAMNLTVTAA